MRSLKPAFFALSIVLNIVVITALLSPDRHESLAFVSPRVQGERPTDILINFMPLRAALQQYVAAAPEKVGVYFEYLPSGVSIGVRDREEFAVASLLKLPLVMAVEHLIENNILRAEDVITLVPEDIDDRFGSHWQQGVGSTMSIDDAVDFALRESDNTAYRVLTRVLFAQGNRHLANVFDSLDIALEKSGNTILVTPKGYSSILRSLFLSSYLSLQKSEDILRTLSESFFQSGLRTGIPQNVAVSHKIGEYNLDGLDPVHSDCGIVYVPRRPFILCVMVSGASAHQSYCKHVV